jgi:hypothetical protein
MLSVPFRGVRVLAIAPAGAIGLASSLACCLPGQQAIAPNPSSPKVEVDAKDGKQHRAKIADQRGP